MSKHYLKYGGLRGLCNKALGDDKEKWNEWFVKNIVDPLDVMVKITPKSMVAKDVSFFKTGPDLAD